jgi:hypothetical protein
MTAIVITESAFVAACHPDFPLEQILAGSPPATFENVLIRKGSKAVLVMADTCDQESRLLVIAKKSGFFKDVPADEQATVLERCVRLGLRSLDKKIALSPNWMPYRHDSRTSIFAFASTDLRILAETNYAGSENTYVYDLLSAAKSQDLSSQQPSEALYTDVLSELPKLFAVTSEEKAAVGAPIELEHIAAKSVAKGFAYDEWIPLLSTQQRDFVEREITGPIRVRGAAGTGKTLAMVMKVLKLAKDGDDNPQRILFVTHSWSMAAQVDEMIQSIGRDIPAASLVEVYPLLEIASQRDYNAIGRRPLGLDSEAGKRETLAIINKLIEDLRLGDWVGFRSGCSVSFIEAFESPKESRSRRNMAWDVLIEFACVLAAQGLLGRGNDLERYLRIRRVGYMMPLSTTTEKEVVFRLWSDFLSYLKVEGLISSDQIVSDYLNELQTFYWEAKRSDSGYDYVFVDEMHLFNAQERLVFHNLLADGDRVPRVVMALDPKQSPREVFTEVSEDRDAQHRSIYERARLPNPDKVDLVEIYRYTTEIAALTRSVLDLVPALDMDDDWNLPGGGSVAGHGPVPAYYLENDATGVFRRGLEVAFKMQSGARSRGGQVAILCMDFDRFNTYRRAAKGQYPRDVFVIGSRDDVEQLRYMSRRIVFSAPEYVAGLQFDSVVLLDVNGDLVPDTNYKGHQERRFLSELYLGMSRAQRQLVLVASRDSDGLTPYLRKQEQAGIVVSA